MLIAHVEAQGVWKIAGGMNALANALAMVAQKNGAQLRYGSAVRRVCVRSGQVTGVELVSGEKVAARAVVCNADPAALASGLLGAQADRAVRAMPIRKRSLSALVWLVHAQPSGFALDHHNVFFSRDYPREFAQIGSGQTPSEPSVYVCNLDHGEPTSGGAQRLQIIVNAPANGDSKHYSAREKDQCTANMLRTLTRCGLSLPPEFRHQLLTPNDFSARFPATGGALYGRASHGWAASFLRPGSRTAIAGLYCAGGATHPGAGVPMAALSGRLASEAVLSDHISIRRSPRRAIAGGISTRSATTSVSG
jgi:1-hydroxycarotenoid 3,4-desaturase